MQAAKLLAASGTATKLYAEDVFSAYTYTGNGSTQTITNGIDLASNGGLVWIKERSSTGFSHRLWYTASGTSSTLHTHDVGGLGAEGGFTSFNSNGFTLNTTASNHTNYSGATFVGWTFRNADKFYNHATVTKTAGSNATVSFANLTTLGMVRVKRTDSNSSWYIWHRSLTAGKLLIGETTAAEATLGHITVSGTTVTLVNGVIANGTYLVEGFAHDTSADGLIQCGSYIGNGSATGPTITLGFEPQFLLVKATAATADPSTNNWFMADVAREMSMTNTVYLLSNASNPEDTGNNLFNPTATGFKISSAAQGINNSGTTYIYLAIRRPNKPPTTGTQVYNAIARTGTGAAATVTGVGFAPDLLVSPIRGSGSYLNTFFDRLRGAGKLFGSARTDAEITDATTVTAFGMDGVSLGADSGGYTAVNQNTYTYINWFFKRAPGVMDVVCYTGTGSATTVAHGLGAVPELLISKTRSGVATRWYVYHATVGATKFLGLNETATPTTATAAWNDTAPTSSVFSVGSGDTGSTATHVAYLFATLAGISKVFSYTGNGGTAGSAGTSQTINCGFTTGARFVMLKCTSHTSDWVIVDTVRGLIAGSDPALSLNTTAAEVTTTDLLDPDVSGFVVNQLATGTTSADFNVTGRTYIGLAFS